MVTLYLRSYKIHFALLLLWALCGLACGGSAPQAALKEQVTELPGANYDADNGKPNFPDSFKQFLFGAVSHIVNQSSTTMTLEVVEQSGTLQGEALCQAARDAGMRIYARRESQADELPWEEWRNALLGCGPLGLLLQLEFLGQEIEPWVVLLVDAAMWIHDSAVTQPEQLAAVAAPPYP